MQQILRARLRAAMPGVTVDWNLNRQGVSLPRVALFLINAGAEYHNQGPSGQRQGRVQVDCYAAHYDAATALAALVRGALSGWSDRVQGISGVFLQGETDLPPDTEGAVQIARVSSDYIINWQEG